MFLLAFFVCTAQQAKVYTFSDRTTYLIGPLLFLLLSCSSDAVTRDKK